MKRPSLYQYDFEKVNEFLRNNYDPQEIADRLGEVRLALAEQMAKDDFGSEWKILCYRLLFDLEDLFRKLQRL